MGIRIRFKSQSVASGVAPTANNQTFNIDDGYADNEAVGTFQLTNSPSPAVTYSITAGNTGTTFAINSSTGAITVIEPGNLVADADYTLTITISNSAGSITPTATINVAEEGAEVLLRTIVLQEESAAGALASGSYIQVPVAFAEGEIPSGQIPEARKADGTTAFTDQQFDRRKYWDDGSLWQAVCHFKLENSVSSNSTTDLKFYNKTGSLPASSGDAFSDFQAVCTANLIAVISGTTYTMNASDNTGNARKIMDGPVVTAWEVFGRLQNGGTPHANMWAILWCYLYADGSWGLAGVLGNGVVGTVTSLTVTSSSLRNNTSAISSLGSSTLSAHSAFWFGESNSGSDIQKHYSAGRPRYHLRFDMDELEAASITWALENDAPFISAIGSAPTATYDPDNNYAMDHGQDDGGPADTIGHICQWDAAALITQNKAWAKYQRVMHAGSFQAPVHMVEATGGYLPVINNRHGSYSLGGDRHGIRIGTSGPTISITGYPSNYLLTGSHYPPWAYMAGMLTGDPWWVREAQAHNISTAAKQPEGTSNGTFPDSWHRDMVWDGTTHYASLASEVGTDTFRSTSWYLRNRSYANAITPDDDPHAQYMKDMLTISGYDTLAVLVEMNIDHIPGRATLGLIDTVIDGNLSCGFSPRTGPWMHDYMAFTIAMDIQRGIIDASHDFVTHHVEKFIIGRALNGCTYWGAGPFRICIKPSNSDTDISMPGGTVITNWNQAYGGSNVAANRFQFQTGGSCPSSGYKNDDNVDSYEDYNGNAGGHAYAYLHWSAMKVLSRAAVNVPGAATVAAYHAANDSRVDVDNTRESNPQFSIKQ